MVFKETEINKKDNIILFVFTALIAMFKFIYILIAGILFIRLFSKKQERKNTLKSIGIMILIGSVFSIGWIVFTLRYKSVSPAFEEYNKIANVNSAEQINFIKEYPIRFTRIFVREYLIYGSKYIFGNVGSILGWLEIKVDLGVVVDI